MATASHFQAVRHASEYIRQQLPYLSVREKALTIACLRDIAQHGALVESLADELAQALPKVCRTANLEVLFLVVNVLYECRPAAITGAILAKITHRLIACEVQPGGPYRNASGVTEPMANAQIAVCMLWAGKSLPQVLAYISDYFDVEQLTDSISPYAQIWKHSIEITNDLNSLPGHFLADYIVTAQRADGSWAPAASNLGQAATNIFSLSPVVTTLLAMRILQMPTDPGLSNTPTVPRHIVVDRHGVRVLGLVQQRVSCWPAPLASGALKQLNAVQERDTQREISLLPLFFSKSLIHPQATIPDDLCDSLGAANVLIWIAYTIYDDFLDEEGRPDLLPIANVCCRHALQMYVECLPTHQVYGTFLDEVFDAIEAAHAWEITHCHLPITNGRIDMSHLPDLPTMEYAADRAFFHALGPMIILAHQGIRPHDPAWKCIRTAMRHYLIARQLNDDLHDWRADLQNGHITQVVLEILQRAGATKGAHSFTELLPGAQRVFWQEVLPDICQRALKRIEQARQEFVQSQLLVIGNDLDQLLKDIEDSMHQALIKRQQSHDFLQSYASEAQNQ